MNFIEKTNYKTYRDEDGVILLNYFGSLGLQYNPNAIAQQALGFYDLHLNEPENHRHVKDFLTQARWFLRQGRMVKDNVLLWEYGFPWKGRRFLEAPWRSALAQGQAISVLLRVHQLTGDSDYLDAAHAGYNAFKYEGHSHEGGVIGCSAGHVWLEEVIHKPYNHILNGFVWALWGVRDYALYCNDEHALKLYEACLATLHANLHRYDIGFWTTYDLVDDRPNREPRMPCSLYYQNLHSVQMLACHRLSGRQVFLDFHKRWGDQLNSLWKRVISQAWKCYFKVRHF